MASAVRCDSAPCFSQSHVTGTKVCGPTKQRIPPEVISNSQVACKRGVGTQSSKRYPRCDHQLATLIPSWAWCMCEMRHERDGHCRCSSSCLVRLQACKSQQMKMSKVCSEKHAFVKGVPTTPQGTTSSNETLQSEPMIINHDVCTSGNYTKLAQIAQRSWIACCSL